MKAAVAAIVGGALFLSIPAGAASFPPELRFRTLSAGPITVHYHQGLDRVARQAALLAEEILARHEQRYGHRVGRLHVVLADVEDEPNGFAAVFPYPMVQVRMAAPRGNDELGNYEDWLRLVLTHELAHIVHLDFDRGLVRAGRRIFGRAPFLFPNASAPTWMIEGLATYEETENTAFGRGRNSDSDMVMRMAALEGAFPHEDQPILRLDRWPGGQAAYFFGEDFLRDLSRQFGTGTLPALARVQASRPLPYTDELTSRRVTGASFNTRWERWRTGWLASAGREAERLRADGLSPSVPLTTRGVRQTGGRFSPDGAWIAYTSRSLTRFGQIRLVRPDGSGDRVLVRRNGGAALSWTPDGAVLVFDEPEVFRLFTTRFDLRAVEVRTGRVRRLTRGLRAREPDVAPDGSAVVFVRRLTDRSELFTIALDGSALRQLTSSPPGTQWSGPRWSPDGRRIAVSRWMDGGFLDIVLVDPAGGGATPLTADRARDVEPAWTPDGTHVLFRSDRDGISNLYACRLEDGALLRVTRVLGGAFNPGPSPDGTRLVFADYSSRGYDLRLMDLDLARVSPAAPYEDPYPPRGNETAPAPAADRPYRPFPALLPRFWMPFLETVSGELRLGAAISGSDPLLRHSWAADVHRGFDTGKLGFQLFYRYDRFRPTFVLATQEAYEPSGTDTLLHKRELLLEADLPLRRSQRASQTAAVAWRRRRETLSGPQPDHLDLGGLEVGWALSTTQQYPYSVSPVDGGRLSLRYVKEAPALGSDVALGKVVMDARLYQRLAVEGDAFALRVGAGTTIGRPSFQRSFAVGGFPDGALFDIVDTNHTVLRGYPESAFRGRHYVAGNLEYRLPLVHPQRGWRTFPLFLRHLHAFAFADAAQAWSGRFAARDLKTSAGGGLGADVAVAHVLPLTWTVSVARGFAARGDTVVYFRTGLAF